MGHLLWRELRTERDRYRDLLQRILDSYEDGTINVPEVDRAVEEEIRAALSRMENS